MSEVTDAIENTVKALLSLKHLYQHADVPWAEIEKNIRARKPPVMPPMPAGSGHSYAGPKAILDSWVHNANFSINNRWWPTIENSKPQEGVTNFRLPAPIKLYCSECREIDPFNPTEASATGLAAGVWQVFSLEYQCQGCRTFVVFLVTRKGLRLTLSGRSEIESFEVPEYIPKDERPYYVRAIRAFNSNEILASLSLLRTCIEQYMRSVLLPKIFDSAEELCRSYNQSLQDEDFKGRAPSLPDVYSVLSAAMHEANEDPETFKTQLGRIEKHFEAKRIFESLPKLRNEKATN